MRFPFRASGGKYLSNSALLVLEDGSIFRGRAIGANGQAVGEVVFNTSMTGYQEILTDPSYARQIITLTYPHIGNTGTNAEDVESAQVFAAGLVIRDLPLLASNFRNELAFDAFLRQRNVVAIADMDTRRLTRLLRTKGALTGCILAGSDLQAARAQKIAEEFPGLSGMDLAKEVSCNKPYAWEGSTWALGAGYRQMSSDDFKYHVVAYDFGVKHNILRMLVERACRVTVVPAQTPAADVLALNPDGVFLSNGPGDPEPCDYAIQAIAEILKTDLPVFGICLGHQLLCLAGGAKTVKMKFGHHGANHPVQDLANKSVMITSQNHGFAVDEQSLPTTLRASHRSLFDNSLQGVKHVSKPVFGFQGHPEASPGPHDIAGLFDQFVESIAIYKSSTSAASTASA